MLLEQAQDLDVLQKDTRQKVRMGFLTLEAFLEEVRLQERAVRE